MASDSFNEDDAGYNLTAMPVGSKIMLAALLVLFTAALLFLGLNIYARYFLGRRGSFRRRHLSFVSEQDPPRLHSVGLGKSAIEELPVFVYQTANHKDGLECAVCLCEFEDNEKARLLPKCHHSFHIDCIDMWFHSHSTCPLCRASAEPDTPPDSVVVLIADEEAAPGIASETDEQVPLPTVSEGNESTSMEPDIDIDLCPSCRHDEVLPSPTYPTNMLFWPTQKRVSSMSNSAFFDRGTTSTSGKTLDKISIDIPRRADSFSSPRLFSSDDQQAFSPSEQLLKTRSIRLRSLKKLLSKGKKVVPQSPDAGRNIPIEQEGPSSELKARVN
jgi:hypothetical protein